MNKESCYPAITILTMVLALFSGVFSEVTRMLLADEGNKQIHYFNLEDDSNDWTINTPDNNHDMQLIGNNQLMVSTGKGYYVFNLSDGSEVKGVTGFGSVRAARRMPDGHTWLCRGDPAEMVELDENDQELRRIKFSGTKKLRLVRVTAQKTFLFGSGNRLIEGDTAGTKVWEVDLGGTYQAVRLQNGNTLSSTGYKAKLHLVSPVGEILVTWKQSIQRYLYLSFLGRRSFGWVRAEIPEGAQDAGDKIAAVYGLKLGKIRNL